MNNNTWMAGFVSGLVCGEGNFTVAIVKCPTCKLGYSVRAVFQIELHIHDARLLEQIRDFFGFGYVNYPKPRTRSKNESPTCRYYVTAIPDLFKLVEFFKTSPLIGVKQNSFEIWSQCIEIIAQGRHTSKAGFDEIVTLRSNVNHIRRPSTYRVAEEITSPNVVDGRKISSWTIEEKSHIQRYLLDQISRSELDTVLKRSEASISNKISRMRHE